MIIQEIDKGKPFDWGKTSADYAKFRDIYPQEFYDYILNLGLCKDGQKVLDIGTGTGVLPRNMYKYGAEWTGTDISENQIEQAKGIAEDAGMDIDFLVSKAEEVSFPDETFDVITACQCIWYLKHNVTAPKFAKMLKPGGHFLILYMGWLPYEDEVAGKSEEIILKYNPNWNGYGDTVHPVWVPDEYLTYFNLVSQKEFRVDVPFTRESWHGRMRACRGVGASMSPADMESWDKEHFNMLEAAAPESFTVKHYVSIAELQVKSYKMTGTNEFTTERLVMRRYHMDDSLILYEKFGCDPQMYKYSGWNPYASYDMAYSTVQRFIESYKLPDFYGWAIEHEGQLIGTIGAYEYDPKRNCIEIGLSIERDSWGNGYATEALIGVIGYLTDHEGIKVITAWCASDNAGSKRAMQKAGLKQTAIEKDALEVDGIVYDKLFFEYVSRYEVVK